MPRLTMLFPFCACILMFTAAPVQAQPRLTVAVGGGYQGTTTRFDDSFEFTLNRETGRSEVEYPIDAGPVFDGGFAVRLWRGLGAGLAFSYFKVDGGVHASSSVPHPLLFQHNREISGDADGIRRQEKAVHILAQYTLPAFGQFHVTVMGGPSVLDINQTVVTRVRYTEEYPYDTATFAGVDSRNVTGTKTGFNVGADLSWMFARHVGVGGLVRYTRAPIDLNVDDRTIRVDAGGAHATAGVRIAF